MSVYPFYFQIIYYFGTVRGRYPKCCAVGTPLLDPPLVCLLPIRLMGWSTLEFVRVIGYQDKTSAAFEPIISQGIVY